MKSLICAFTFCLFALQYFCELKYSPKLVYLGEVCKILRAFTVNFCFAAKRFETRN